MRPPLWRVHCVAVLLLTAINLYLLVKLSQCDARGGPAHWNASQGVDYAASGVEHSWKLVRVRESFEPDESDDVGAVWTRQARFDASRRFAVRDFAIVGPNFRATAVEHNVCLATQSSLDRLVSLAEAADHWRGAVSVAVYCDADEARVLERVVHHLRRCHAELLSYVALHVVSAAPPPGSDPLAAWADAFSGAGGPTANCSEPPEALAWLSRHRPPLSAKWESGRAYPQNLMRNVARKGCPAEFVMLLDVDVIPSRRMARQVARFLAAAPRCDKCAYVVPTYELERGAEFPRNKTQLLAYESQGRAQPFHHKAFRYNQYASNLTR